MGKRGQKGLLITIGDEACHGNIHKDSMRHIFSGDELPTELTASKALSMAQEKWVCQHIRLGFMSNGKTDYVKNNWNNLLPEHPVAHNEEDVVRLITKLATQICGQVGCNVSASTVDSGNSSINPSDIIL